MYNKTHLDSQPVKCQSSISRKRRLKQGRCPVHDMPLLQCDGWYQSYNGRRYTVISCIHRDCRVEALTDLGFRAYQLTPKWQYLLGQNEWGTAYLFEFRGVSESDGRGEKGQKEENQQ